MGRCVQAQTWERIRSHKKWADVMNDMSIVDHVRRAHRWARDCFAARGKPTFYLDLDAPGFQWQGRVARFFLSGCGLEPVFPPSPFLLLLPCGVAAPR